MPNVFDSLINDLNKRITDLGASIGTLNTDLVSLSIPNPPLELQETYQTFVFEQLLLTNGTSGLLSQVPPLKNGSTSATIQDLNTATNLIQLYFQGTQPLEQTLSNLVDLLSSTDIQSALEPEKFQAVRNDIFKVLGNRKELQKSFNKALREFSSEIDELKLENLLKDSAAIRDQLVKIHPQDNNSINTLTPIIDALIEHLQNAQVLFKAFNKKSEELTGNEPDDIKQLIRNWGDSVAQIEQIELGSEIQKELSDPNNSRPAIARTIQVQSLLEINYDYLTALIRSGDLESAGIL